MARRPSLWLLMTVEAKAREREAMAKASDALMGGGQRYLPAVDRGAPA